MPTESIHIRLSSDLYERLHEYASKNTDGVINRAVNELLERALDSEKEDVLAATIDAAVERGLTRVAKAASRGTKASLASLILLSQAAPGLADTQHFQSKMINKMLGESKDRWDYDEDLEEDYRIDLECAEYELRRFRSRSAENVFDWAWKCAGNIQKAGSKPTLETAKNGVDLYGGMQ